MIVWTVSYQTTNMKIFEWIGWGKYISHTSASNAAVDIFSLFDKEEIVNIRIRRERS